MDRSGLKVVFHQYAKSLSSWLAEILGLYTVENNVTFAKSLTVNCKLSGIIHVYKTKVPTSKIEPHQTPACIGEQLEH